MAGIRQDYSIDIVEKSLRLLELFEYQAPRLTLDQIAGRLGISKTRAFRIAQTMLACEFLRWNAEVREYSLGPACQHLGLVARTGDALKAHILQTMYALHRDSEETVNLALVQDHHLYYATILESPHAFRVSEAPGDVVPWEGTALGRAFLAAVTAPAEYVEADRLLTMQAALERTKSRGYALDDQESVPGVRCVGVPIRGRAEDGVIGALSISGPVSRMTDAHVRHWGERLKAAVAEFYTSLEGARV